MHLTVLSPGGQYQSHGEDVVVATGYSDAVPPNTTVYIYTTNGGMSEQVAIDETTGEHIVLQEVPAEEDATLLMESHSGSNSGKVMTVSEPVDGRQVVTQQQSGKQMTSLLNDSKTSSRKVEEPTASQQFVNGRSDTSSSGKSIYSNTATTSLSPLRRIMPGKKSVASPWAVQADDDAQLAALMADPDNVSIYNSPASENSNQATTVTLNTPPSIPTAERGSGGVSDVVNNGSSSRDNVQDNENPLPVPESKSSQMQQQLPSLPSLNTVMSALLQNVSETGMLDNDNLTSMRVAEGLPALLADSLQKDKAPKTSENT